MKIESSESNKLLLNKLEAVVERERMTGVLATSGNMHFV